MTGQTISHYRILDKLGEGGMGVVYKAEDTKLERTVALKFLAAHLLNDPEAKQRFLREAKAAAALQHPNICTVHEIDEVEGKTFLAMAFLKGETLEERIAKGPLPLKDAVEIGRQVGEGLAAAHGDGIVHRDIKPANILVSPEGRATIMDFGLARLTEASKLTRADQTVGTAAYMSPEQIQGSEVDHRTDVWALGCVLYEMVAGLRPFKGQYDQALLYEIGNQEPEPLTGVRAGLPMEIELYVGKCLAKDAADRYGSASEIARDLRTLGERLKSGHSRVMSTAGLAGVPATMTTGRTLYPAQAFPADAVVLPKRRLRALQAALAALGLALLLGGAAYFTRTVPEAPGKLVRRISFTADNLTGGVISPDGRFVAYNVMVESNAATGAVWLRSLEDETSRELPGTEGAIRSPFWSPDSLSIGFATFNPNRLKRIAIDGGAPTVLCEMTGPFQGGTWSPDGERIVFSSGQSLYEVAARGGRPRPLSKPDPTIRQGAPHFVPTKGGPPILVYQQEHNVLDVRLMALDMAGGESAEIGPGKQPFYSPEGILIHSPGTFEGEGLWALPFSPETMQVTGEAFPVSTSGGAASVSRDGAMAYSDRNNTQMSPKTLVWRNRAGEIVETVGQPQPGLREFALSPDGRWVAVTVDEPPDIWIQDLARSTVTRLTFDPGPEYNTSWTASGREVAYTRAIPPPTDKPNRLMLKAADGTGEASMLADFGAGQSNADWSRDGRYVVYSGGGGEGKGNDIFYVELDKTGDERKPKPFLSTPANESIAKISPDGRFVAYISTESGKPEIYIRPFPSGAGRWQVSVNGGKQPRWRRDGKELFFVEDDIRLMAVSVATAGEGVALGQPQRLFESQDLNFRAFTWPEYEVSPDGQRFLTSTLVDPDVPPTMRVVLNWFEPFRNRERE